MLEVECWLPRARRTVMAGLEGSGEGAHIGKGAHPRIACPWGMDTGGLESRDARAGVELAPGSRRIR